MPWIKRLKLKMFAYLVGIALCTFAAISIVGAPALPVIGVAVAAAAVSVSKFTERLGKSTCLQCGLDLNQEPLGEHGIACPRCGGVHQAGMIEMVARAARERTKM